MASLTERLMKANTLEYADVLYESEVYQLTDMITTPVPIMNVGLSGRVDGGLTPGVTTIAGPSRHFKTGFALIMGASYLKYHPEAVLVFYDSEFGSPETYFTSVGIDPKRVIHKPVTSLEDLRTDLVVTLNEIKRNEKVIFLIDSLGNLASNKEIKDAEEGSEKADMTRAKVMKSMFRIITPKLRLKNIPLVNISHVYDTMELYSKKIVSGGTAIMLASDNVWIVGRQQEKDGTEMLGYNFTINVEKSRYVKEKSKFNMMVSFKSGVLKWSGLFDEAKELGLIEVRPGKGRYGLIGAEKSFTRKEVDNNGEFWKEFFVSTDFSDRLREKFSLGTATLLSDDDNNVPFSDEDLEGEEEIMGN